jgi:hypothetical protein
MQPIDSSTVLFAMQETMGREVGMRNDNHPLKGWLSLYPAGGMMFLFGYCCQAQSSGNCTFLFQS